MMHRIALLLIVSLTPTLQAADVASVVAQARARLGTEQALKAVQSLEYEGTVYGPEGEEQSKLTLIFKKPDQQKLIVDSADMKSETAVNGYEGFIEITDKNDPKKSGVLVLDAPRVRRLLSNAAENLYFFQGPEHRTGGKISYEGIKTSRGKECNVLRFSYPSGLFYTRYFEVTNGELVSTINGESNQEMVESDSVTVNGVRFPKTVKTYDDEGDLIRTVVFTKILVNEPIDNSIFDFPGTPVSNKP